MKNKRCGICATARALIGAICALAIFMPFLCLGVHASGGEDIEVQISDGLSGAAEEIHGLTGSESALELAGDGIEGTGEALLEFLTVEQVLGEILGITADTLPDILRLTLTIAGLLIISAISHSLCDSLGTGAVSSGFELLSASAMITAIVGTQLGQLERVASFFEGLTSLMTSMIPITGIVWAMGGNVMSASAGTATLYAMLATTQGLCSSTVLPVCYTMGMAAICSGVSGGGLLDGFVGAVKKIYNFIIGAIMTVFVFVLGAQTAIAGSADTAAARGAKLISSTVIPVVGGAVGDTLRTVAGSVGYIKSVVGVGGIVLILVLTLPTLISLLLSRLVFLITSGMADVLGCKREGRLLSELGNIYAFLIGAVSVCSVAFIVAMGLFVKCAVAVE